MIKLYGLRMSNYYSLAKALMIEKGIEYEEVKAPPSQEEDYLERSPMGKMPSIEVNGRFLSESIAIFQYLEQLVPGLLPEDPFEAAKAMELVCHMKLDVELVARRCLPELLFNKPVSDETKKEVFVHRSGVREDIQEDDRVTYRIEQGQKGLTAVDVEREN